MEIHAISRLRLAIATGKIHDKNMLFEKVEDRIQRVLDFEAGKQREPFPLRDVPDVGMVAAAFKLAAMLYAVQTLPHPAATMIDRQTCCQDLLALLKVMIHRRRCQTTLSWPLAILGASLFDASRTEQEIILDCLSVVQQGPLSCAANMATKVKLIRFWRSGKMGWEDCWPEVHLSI